MKKVWKISFVYMSRCFPVKRKRKRLWKIDNLRQISKRVFSILTSLLSSLEEEYLLMCSPRLNSINLRPLSSTGRQINQIKRGSARRPPTKKGNGLICLFDRARREREESPTCSAPRKTKRSLRSTQKNVTFHI
jgi:hypothetical protein